MFSYKVNNQLIQNVIIILKRNYVFLDVMQYYKVFKKNELDFYLWILNELEEILLIGNLILNNIILFNMLYNVID